jgi:shikimate dehydrogenase
MNIDGRTRLAFLLGYPVAHSLSPAMHQAAFAAAGLNAAYLPWAVSPARLPDAVTGLRALENFLGANVTVPHKEAIFPLLDGLTAEAEAVGAVNTIVRRGDRLEGDNTDGVGFLAALRQELSAGVEGLEAAVLGAGGAARAVAVALARAGAQRIVVVNRSPDRARRLADLVRARFPGRSVAAERLHAGWRPEFQAGRGLLVNTTSVGLHAEDPPLFAYESLASGMLVCDLIYSPPETPLLRAARIHGCQAANGLGMLLHQGALAFERWLGRRAPVHAMRRALGLPEGGFPLTSKGGSLT